MSFFKKIAKEFENLGIGDKDEKKQEAQQGYPQGQDNNRAYGDGGQQYGAPPPQQYSSPPPQQYGAPPPQQYGAPPQQYGSPAPQQQYGA
ncbi:hypothetical protein FAGAP_13337, partial [Fusarium agapanthi]